MASEHRAVGPVRELRLVVTAPDYDDALAVAQRAARGAGRAQLTLFTELDR